MGLGHFLNRWVEAVEVNGGGGRARIDVTQVRGERFNYTLEMGGKGEGGGVRGDLSRGGLGRGCTKGDCGDAEDQRDARSRPAASWRCASRAQGARRRLQKAVEASHSAIAIHVANACTQIGEGQGGVKRGEAAVRR